jgi:LysM repeat protein
VRRCLIAAVIVGWGLALPTLASTQPHSIQKGETLYSLSRRYAVSVREIQEANPSLEPSKIKVGQVIQIPVKEPPAKEGEPTTENPKSQEPNPKVGKGTTSEPDPQPETENKKPETPDSPPLQPETRNQEPGTPVTPEFHTVAKGDTLSSIARQYRMPLAEVRQLNPAASDIISPGQKLRVRKPGPSTLLIDSGPPPEPPVPLPPPPPPPEPTKSKIENPKSKIPPPPPTPKYVFITGKATAGIDKPKINSRDWRYIVIHHSGTRSGNAKIFDYYHRRVRRMENGLAYHFVIGNGTESGDGEIEIGERWLKQLQGGHVRSDAQNEVAIGICLVGDYQRDRPTRRQISSLIELIGYLQEKVGDPAPRMFLHRDINVISTDCPGKNFPAAALYRLFGGQPKRPKE